MDLNRIAQIVEGESLRKLAQSTLETQFKPDYLEVAAALRFSAALVENLAKKVGNEK